MRYDIGDDVCVADDFEIEAPTPVYAGLPLIFCLVVLLGMKGRMAEVEE
jgi:hypothetical protein